MSKSERIAELYRAGMMLKDIAVAVNMAPNSVGCVLKRMGFDRPSKPQKKWYNIDERAVVARWNDGLSTSAIAERYAVSAALVVKTLVRNGINVKSANRRRYDGEGNAMMRGGGLARIARRA